MDNSYDIMWDGQKAGKVKVYDKGLMTVYEGVCAVSTKKILRLCALCNGKYVTIGVLVPDGSKLGIKRSFSKNTMREKGLTNTETFVLMCNEDEFEPIKTAEPVQEETKVEYVPVCNEDAPQEETDSETENETEHEECEAEETENMPDENDGACDADGEDEAPDAVHAFPGTVEDPPAINGWRESADPSSLFCDGELKDACQNIHNAMTKQDGSAMLLAIPWVTGEPFPMMPVFCLGYAENIGGREYIVFRIENGRPV